MKEYEVLAARRSAGLSYAEIASRKRWNELPLKLGGDRIRAHFSKVNQAAKETFDRIGGSEVFARTPIPTSFSTAHELEDSFAEKATPRNSGVAFCDPVGVADVSPERRSKS